MSFFNSLITRSLLGGFLLLLSILAMNTGHQWSRDLQSSTTVWQTKLDTLTDELVKLGHLARNYKDNAPRDFVSYERDLAVFNGQFQAQLQALDTDYQLLERVTGQLNNNPLFQWLNQDDTAASVAMAQQQTVVQSWQVFRADLNETLGDPDQPRLEWGAEQIMAREESLFQQAAELSKQVDTAALWIEQRNQNFNDTMLILVALYVLVSFATFLLFVIRPVVRTAKACQEVSDGQYGLSVDVTGSGETRQLQEAFNELSARAALMLDLVGQLSRTGNITDKLNTILNHSQTALGVNWVGFVELSDDGALLSKSVPVDLDRDWKHRRVSLNKSLGKQLSNIGKDEWLDISNLAETALKHHDERFLRELHKHTNATHVMGYGFTCPKQHRFVLLFTTRVEAGFSHHQQELMRALAKLMVNAVIDGMDNEAQTAAPAHAQTGSVSDRSVSDQSADMNAEPEHNIVDLSADIAALQSR